MIYGAWWRKDCPSRAAGLGHAHWAACNPDTGHPHTSFDVNAGNKHPWNVCCHCEQPAPAEVEPKATEPVPPSVAERLQQMGLMAKVTQIDDIPLEPKMITGDGPQGSIQRHGRFREPGVLSDDDLSRLGFFVYALRFDAVYGAL